MRTADLEAYIYLPTERAAQVKTGLAVDLLDEGGTVLAHSSLDFVSPEVDNDLQGILAKAPIPKSSERLRNGQIVNARITWSTAQTATVPVLAVTRIGGQTFVYVAAPKGGGFSAHQVSVTLGEPIGNVYPVLAGLNTGRPRDSVGNSVSAGGRAGAADAGAAGGARGELEVRSILQPIGRNRQER